MREKHTPKWTGRWPPPGHVASGSSWKVAHQG